MTIIFWNYLPEIAFLLVKDSKLHPENLSISKELVSLLLVHQWRNNLSENLNNTSKFSKIWKLIPKMLLWKVILITSKNKLKHKKEIINKFNLIWILLLDKSKLQAHQDWCCSVMTSSSKVRLMIWKLVLKS